MSKIDYWFDPLCPWSWTTSRWVVSIEDQLGLDLHWRPMSLALLNADGPELNDFEEITSGPIRVCAAVYQSEPDKVGELYTQLGQRFHHSGDEQERVRFQSFSKLLGFYANHADMLKTKTIEALAAAELKPEYIDAYADKTYDDVIAESHEQVPAGAQKRSLIGVPTISVDGSAGLFGPVISEVPQGDDAVQLWQAFVTFSTNPNFFELKRTTDRPAPLAAGSQFAYESDEPVVCSI